MTTFYFHHQKGFACDDVEDAILPGSLNQDEITICWFDITYPRSLRQHVFGLCICHHR